MKARLVIMNPEQAKESPLIPTLIGNDGDSLFLFQDGRSWHLDGRTLDTVRIEDLKAILHLRDTDTVFLSEAGLLPSLDLMSPEVVSFCRKWWHETVREWEKSRGLAKAS